MRDVGLWLGLGLGCCEDLYYAELRFVPVSDNYAQHEGKGEGEGTGTISLVTSEGKGKERGTVTQHPVG